MLQEADWQATESGILALRAISEINGECAQVLPYPFARPRSLTTLELQEADWRARESGILALGAISDGCATGLLPFLEGMLAMLLPRLADARPLVRSITCWALSRYSRWLAHRTGQPGASPQQADAVLQVRSLPCLSHAPDT